MRRAALNWLACTATLSLLSAACTSPHFRLAAPPSGNGIDADVQLYTPRKVQADLKVLSDRLGQVSPIDQVSILAHIGGIQGAESVQYQTNVQATGLGTPSLTTTSTNGTPSIAQTLGTNTTSGTPSTQTTLGQATNSPTSQVQQTLTAATPAVGTTPATPATSQTITTTTTNTSGTTSQSVTTTPGNTTANSNQTVTTTPSNTVQTIATTPGLTPSVPALSALPALASTSTPTPNALGVLGEQLQASFAIVGLRAMLDGAESDDYTPLTAAKRHVTLGFPIGVKTPARYEGAAAEVEITVCNPDKVSEKIDPTAPILLPQENSYNVASMVANSANLGAGAVIAGVLNIGANYSWTHQTYYIVEQEDTLSSHHTDYPPAASCTNGGKSVTFGWQFRPVLGQKIVRPTPRTTYALLALPPSDNPPGDPLNIQVNIRKCWRQFFAKTGLVGNRIMDSCSDEAHVIPSTYNTLSIGRVNGSDNGNGTFTTTVYGHFQPGTRVGLGEAYLDESIPGFENNGKFLRFTSTTQILGTRGARLLSPDGSIAPLEVQGLLDEPVNYQTDEAGNKRFVVPGDFQPGATAILDGVAQPTTVEKGSSLWFPAPVPASTGPFGKRLQLALSLGPGAALTRCTVPYAHAPPGQATMQPYSDTVLEITLPITTCLDVGSVAANGPYVVVMGGKTFGLSDAPFRTSTATRISFLVPTAFARGITTLKLKRLFVDAQYESEYDLNPPGVAVSSVTLASASSYGATFLLTGSGLKHSTIVYPWSRSIACCDTYAFISLTSSELTSVKSIILKPNDGTSPITIALPAAKLTDAEFDDSKQRYSIALVGKSDDASTYVITGIEDAESLTNAQLVIPEAASVLSASHPDDRHFVYSVKAKDASNNKEVIVKTASSKLIILATPAAPKGDEAAVTSKDFKLEDDPKGLAKGASGSYTIKGSNLQLITTIRYLNVPLSFRLAADSKSLTIDQLPTSFTALAGKVPLEIRLTDKTRTVYEVTVK